MTWESESLGLTKEQHLLQQQTLYQQMFERGDFKTGQWICWYNPEVYVTKDTKEESLKVYNQVCKCPPLFVKQIGNTDEIAQLKQEETQFRDELKGDLSNLLE